MGSIEPARHSDGAPVPEELVNDLPPAEGSEASAQTEAAPRTIELTPAMLDAAPPPDDMFRGAYIVGAIAAAHRRAHPVTLPQEFSKLVNVPRIGNEVTDAEHLPHAASPIVELVREEAPDLVISADRGSRLFGLAVYEVWRRRYPDVPFPTIDGKLHFGRISKAADEEDTWGVLEHIVNRSGVMAEMAQRRAEGDERPAKVLFLDDWVLSGSTVDMSKYYLQLLLGGHHNLEFMLGTMSGFDHRTIRPHVIGNPEQTSSTWNDYDPAVGIKYHETPTPIDLSTTGATDKDTRSWWQVAKGVWPTAFKTRQARELREDLIREVKQQVVCSTDKYPAPKKIMFPARHQGPSDSLSKSGRPTKKYRFSLDDLLGRLWN